MFDYVDVKDEMMGAKGLIKEVRGKYMPSTKQMAALAQERFLELGGSASAVDAALSSLMSIEYEIYRNKEQLVKSNFVRYAEQICDSNNFPVVHEIIGSYRASVRAGLEPTHALSGIAQIITALADSSRQSRVSRAGSSLMHHISFLLQKNGFVFGDDYQREFILKEGCKLDFFFPNEVVFNREAKHCCSVACQTTANDRFRLGVAQLDNGSIGRICTAIGVPNFGKNLSYSSLTEEKLHEAKSSGVKFVVIGGAEYEKRLKNSPAAMTYSDWFDELRLLRPFWK